MTFTEWLRNVLSGLIEVNPITSTTVVRTRPTYVDITRLGRLKDLKDSISTGAVWAPTGAVTVMPGYAYVIRQINCSQALLGPTTGYAFVLEVNLTGTWLPFGKPHIATATGGAPNYATLDDSNLPIVLTEGQQFRVRVAPTGANTAYVQYYYNELQI